MTRQFDPERYSHRRFNPLDGEWVLVSANRVNRPWSCLEEAGAENDLPNYDSDCYLCPDWPSTTGSACKEVSC